MERKSFTSAAFELRDSEFALSSTMNAVARKSGRSAVRITWARSLLGPRAKPDPTASPIAESPTTPPPHPALYSARDTLAFPAILSPG